MTGATDPTTATSLTDVIIIGAGISGLACAQALRERGITAVVLDKGRGVGGRVATRRIGQHGFDTGAQFFSARSDAFQAEAARWMAAGACAQWTTGLLDDRGLVRYDSVVRYRGRPSMTSIAKHMAAGSDVRCGIEVAQVDAEAGTWTVTTTEGQRFHARQLVMTTPVPQALRLLERGRQSVPMGDAERARLAALRYYSCLCLLADWPTATVAALPPPGALRSEDPAASVQWLLSHRQAGMRISGEGLIIHMGGLWSDARYERSDDDILSEAVPAAQAAVQRWCGDGWTFVTPPQLKKWRYAHVLNPITETCWKLDVGAPLILAGDAFGAAPRIEGAWCSGRAAAQQISRA